MNSDDIDFIARTETIRNFSNTCFGLSWVCLLFFEGWFPSIRDDLPSGTAIIVLALLGIGLRLIAIDRFLQTAR